MSLSRAFFHDVLEPQTLPALESARQNLAPFCSTLKEFPDMPRKRHTARPHLDSLIQSVLLWA